MIGVTYNSDVVHGGIVGVCHIKEHLVLRKVCVLELIHHD